MNLGGGFGLGPFDLDIFLGLESFQRLGCLGEFDVLLNDRCLRQGKHIRNGFVTEHETEDFDIVNPHAVLLEVHPLAFAAIVRFRSQNAVPDDCQVPFVQFLDVVMLRHPLEDAADVITEVFDVVLHVKPLVGFSLEVDTEGEFHLAGDMIRGFDINEVTDLVVRDPQVDGTQQIVGGFGFTATEFKDFEGFVVFEQDIGGSHFDPTIPIFVHDHAGIPSVEFDGGNAIEPGIQRDLAGLRVLRWSNELLGMG
jgi:hypothetical protein